MKRRRILNTSLVSPRKPGSTLRNFMEESPRDARSVYGNVQIAFGENYSLGGKKRPTPHEDLVMGRETFELDGEVVVENGDIVPEELK